MFTGIIETLGKVAEIERVGVDAKLSMVAQWPDGDLPGVRLGDSVAINGTCLTVVDFEVRDGDVVMRFDASHETLRLTSLGQLGRGDTCNLERALRPADRLGGHIVSGHVDCTGRRERVRKTGDCWDVTYSLPPEIAPEVAHKGSIAIDGVSLTVNRVEGAHFGVTLIPHTVSETQLLEGRDGKLVNLESDVLAKYVRRLLGQTQTGVSVGLLRDSGFLGD